MRISAVVGIDLLAWAGYSYNTRVNLPGGGQAQYNGSSGAPGLAFYGGGGLTLPGASRRITIGGTINAGAIDSRQKAVIPANVSPPFSKSNLMDDIRLRYASSPGWHSAFSPFIEHEIGFFHENRVRIGYQYWAQTGSYTGAFPPNSGSRELAGYNVQLSTRAHMVRLSVNDYVPLEDADNDPNTPHRKRRYGLIRQWGVSVGSNRTIVVFAGIGPYWEGAR
jgi:hypothetical protein